MEHHHMLGERQVLSAWLQRKNRHWILHGAKWKRGFWVLDRHRQTIQEFRGEDKKQRTFEIDPRTIKKICKFNRDDICVVLADDKEVILKTPDETVRTKWIEAIGELLFEVSDALEPTPETDDSPRVASTSRARSIRNLVIKSFRLSRRNPLGSSNTDSRPQSLASSSEQRVSSVEAFSMTGKSFRDLSASTPEAGDEGTRLGESVDEENDLPKKRVAVIPTNLKEEEEKIAPERFVKTPEQRQKLIRLIENEFNAFASGTLLKEMDSDAVIDLIYRVEISKNTSIVTQGEPSDKMFIIERGVVGVYSQDFEDRAPELEVEKRENEIVGLLSLLYNQPAPFTIKTHTDCVLWALPSKKFHELSTNEVKRRLAKKVRLLEKVPLIAGNIDPSSIAQLADTMEYRDYQEGQVVLRAGEEFTSMLVVAEGEAELRDEGHGKVVKTLQKGDVFGEWALLDFTSKSDLTLVASTQLTALSIDRSQVEEVVGPLRKVLLERWLELSQGMPLSPETAAAIVTGMDHGNESVEIMETLPEEAEDQSLLHHQHILAEMLQPLKDAAAAMMEHHHLPHPTHQHHAMNNHENTHLQHTTPEQEPLNLASSSDMSLQASSAHHLHHDQSNSDKMHAHKDGRHSPHHINQRDHSASDKTLHSHSVASSSDKSLRHHPLASSEKSLHHHLGPAMVPASMVASNSNDKPIMKTSERSFHSGATKSSRTARSSRTMRSDRSMMSLEERRRRTSMLAAAMTELTKEQQEQAIGLMMQALKDKETQISSDSEGTKPTGRAGSFTALAIPPPSALLGTRSMPDAVSPNSTGVFQPGGLDSGTNEGVVGSTAINVSDGNMRTFVSVRQTHSTEHRQRQENYVLDDEGNLDRPFERCAPLRSDLVMESIELCALLGRGSFGTVHLARTKRRHDEVFALKVLTRHVIVRNGWEKMVENERNAMNELSTIIQSPFILKLWNSFTDPKHVYLLLELCEGGDLFKMMKRQTKTGKFTEAQAMFYFGCVVLGLEGMHSLDIVYRDLKPENLMVTRNGYIKLADFGLAKKTLRTFTVCGTPEYMAPETLLSQGHNFGVDWWAAGVMLFELIHGETPFGVGVTSDVYEAILDHESVNDLKFPLETRFSNNAKDLIKNLIHPMKNKRLGVKYPGVEGIKQHPFFQDLNWVLLEKLGLPAPIIPNITEVVKLAKQPHIKYDAKLHAAPDDVSGWTLAF